MKGYIDLHSHWIAGIDDGCRTDAEGIALLEGLFSAGFSRVFATPHMRPGMFDNAKIELEQAYARMLPLLAGRAVPEVGLACEHFFDETVYARMKAGECLPYPPRAGTLPARKRSVLVEFSTQLMPTMMTHRIVDLGRVGLRLVIAHPERYRPVWEDDRCLDAVLDQGAYLLLDLCALTGKYGRASQEAAERLLDDGAYEAACSDAHRPDDCQQVQEAIVRLRKRVGEDEASRLLIAGPKNILSEAIP